MLTEWDKRFLTLAQHVGKWSKDRSKKVGAVIASESRGVLSVGFNAFPEGAADLDERHERPAKYFWTEHAERNAIYHAARNGISLDGSTLYIPWFPCMDCARAIVQVGIRRLVAARPDVQDERWGGQFAAALALLEECRIDIEWTNELLDL
jgi:dCMP deaminase